MKLQAKKHTKSILINFTVMEEQKVLDLAKKHNQFHLVEHYESLIDQKKKQNFLNQLRGIDFEQTDQLFRHVYLETKQNKGQEKVEFTPVENVCSVADLDNVANDLNLKGLEAISKGELGVCIMSGGQGTRLGFDHPKGMYNLGLHSNLTLFGFFAHRLIRLMHLTKQKFPHSVLSQTNMIKWYIMTSEMNHEEVCEYFKSNDYFGYHPESIVFFPQGGIPALSYNGKIVIESEGQVSLAPGGNGAIYGEMRNRGVLEHMKNHGVKYIYLGPVDNVLLKVGDPLSLGYMVKNHFDIVSHYIKKRNPEQKVGIHVNINGNVKICEYSEVSKQVTQLRNKDGELVYGQGSRATMYVTRQFIEKITGDPATVEKINKKYHLAEKKIKYYDPVEKKVIKPSENNGVKFELFYFDVFEEANKFALFETLREEEFAPLKNATGDDSPDSARKMLHDLHRKWVEKVGIKLEGEGDVEIDPIVSYNGQGLKEWVQQKFGSLNVNLPLYIE